MDSKDFGSFRDAYDTVIAETLARKHPDLAREWGGHAYADLAASDAQSPYERIDGLQPVNDRYNASVGPLLGMGLPAETSSVTVTLRGDGAGG